MAWNGMEDSGQTQPQGKQKEHEEDEKDAKDTKKEDNMKKKNTFADL